MLEDDGYKKYERAEKQNKSLAAGEKVDAPESDGHPQHLNGHAMMFGDPLFPAMPKKKQMMFFRHYEEDYGNMKKRLLRGDKM